MKGKREVMYLDWALKMIAERENSPCSFNERHTILLWVLLKNLECESIPCHFLHPIYLISAIYLKEPTTCKVKLHVSVYSAFFFFLYFCKRKWTTGNVRDFTLEKYCVRHDSEKQSSSQSSKLELLLWFYLSQIGRSLKDCVHYCIEWGWHDRNLLLW